MTETFSRVPTFLERKMVRASKTMVPTHNRHADVEEEEDDDDSSSSRMDCGTSSNWNPSSLLRDCRQRGALQVARELLQVCQTVEERDLVEATALFLLQEVRLGKSSPVVGGRTSPGESSSATTELNQARKMSTPYSSHYCAEADEHLFHVWNFLLLPDNTSATTATATAAAAATCSPNNSCIPRNLKASRSARALWSAKRNEQTADRLVWAKQAWDHFETIQEQFPAADASVAGVSGWTPIAESIRTDGVGDTGDQGEAGGTETLTVKRQLSKWINKWCTPFFLGKEEWILLMDPRDFIVRQGEPKNLVLEALASEYLDWLQSKLRYALADWRLISMFPTLCHSIVMEYWKENRWRLPPRVIQCLVFIARVHCAIQALGRDSLERQSLLIKILRCCDLLSKDAQKAFEQAPVSMLCSVQKRRHRLPEEEEPTTKVRRISDSYVSTTSSSIPKDGPIMRGEADTRSLHRVNEKNQSCTPLATSPTMTGGAIPSEEVDTPNVKKRKFDGDPYAVALRKTVRSNHDFLRTFPVEMLDPTTGQVLKLYPSALVAALTKARTETSMKWTHDLYTALFGRRVINKVHAAHIYGGVSLRVYGSTAFTRRPPKAGRQGKSPGASDSKSFVPSKMDPFAAAQIRSGRSLNDLMTHHPVEELHYSTGEIVATFKNLREAATSRSPPIRQPHYLGYAVLGYRLSKERFFGHEYSGRFWRLKGSSALPPCIKPQALPMRGRVCPDGNGTRGRQCPDGNVTRGRVRPDGNVATAPRGVLGLLDRSIMDSENDEHVTAGAPSNAAEQDGDNTVEDGEESSVRTGSDDNDDDDDDDGDSSDDNGDDASSYYHNDDGEEEDEWYADV